MGKMTCLVLFNAAILTRLINYAKSVWATPPLGFVATTLSRGAIGDIDKLNKSIIPDSSEGDRQAKAWLSQQKVKDTTELYVQSNVWQPGGSTGWHTHPGHSLIVVTVGTVTEYEAPDPACKPHIYSKDMTFVDPHGDHAHLIRNEGGTVAKTIAVQLIPVGVARRIDVPDPGNCRF